MSVVSINGVPQKEQFEHSFRVPCEADVTVLWDGNTTTVLTKPLFCKARKIADETFADCLRGGTDSSVIFVFGVFDTPTVIA